MKRYQICDLVIEDHGTEWRLSDPSGQLLVGTREEVAARVQKEMGEAQ